MKSSKKDLKHKESGESPDFEAKSHGKGFLKKALAKKMKK